MPTRTQPVLLRVAMEESQFTNRQGIAALVILASRTGVEITVNSRFRVNLRTLPHELFLKLRRGKRELTFLARIRVDPTAFRFTRLMPGAVIGQRIVLSDYFDIKPGRYRLAVTYVNNDDPPDQPGIVAWKGELRSETSFTVK